MIVQLIKARHNSDVVVVSMFQGMPVLNTNRISPLPWVMSVKKEYTGRRVVIDQDVELQCSENSPTPIEDVLIHVRMKPMCIYI